MVRELFNIEAHSQLARQQRSSGEKDQNDLNETFAIVNRSNQSSRVDNRNIVATWFVFHSFLFIDLYIYLPVIESYK